jgi:D-hydroxyproline dehydrogenase subunit beta
MIKTDVLVVGAGIVGLAHAWEAHQRGLSVCVVEKNARCTGASVRNFGFITVTGQQKGSTWQRAVFAKNTWLHLAEKAKIPILHRGSYTLCEREEAFEVARAFMETDMAHDCELLTQKQATTRTHPVAGPLQDSLNLNGKTGVLVSHSDCRVESRTAIAQLARYLQDECNIAFYWEQEVLSIEEPQVKTAHAVYEADRIIVCPGAELHGALAQRATPAPLKLCTLQMMRVSPVKAIRLPGSVMGDLSLGRYQGWSELPAADALKARLKRECQTYLNHGIHLIVVQSDDGSLVVGDSHHYGDSEVVFSRQDVDACILELLQTHVHCPELRVTERWLGTYPVHEEHNAIIDRISAGLAQVRVTSGTGASTGFGIAKDTFEHWG